MKRARLERGMWWDRAWTLVEGCTPVSAGCQHCWAAAATHMRARQNNPKIRARYEGLTNGNRRPLTGSGRHELAECRFNGSIRLMPESLTVPVHVKQPTSWAIWNDLFHEEVPFEFIGLVFAVAALCPQHTFYMLTKRPERMAEHYAHYDPLYVPKFLENLARIELQLKCVSKIEWPLPNLWLGTSIEDQPTADERIPHLLRCPASARFVSYEPALGPVQLDIPYGQDEGEYLIDGLSWVIAGGESGPGARPAHPDWFRSVRDQCVEAGVPFFFKQWGEYAPGCQLPSDTVNLKTSKSIWMNSIGETGRPGGLTDADSSEDGMRFWPVGKKKAGRLLDGLTWSQMPQQQGVGSRA